MGLIATYPKLRHDWLKHEPEPHIFRKEVTVASGAGDLITGTVMAKVGASLSAASAAKSGGNTGNGTLTLDATNPVLAGGKLGVYTVRCIAAAANSGTFRVEDPDGVVLGDVAVAATFADDVKFVIADGSSDFIVGDGFDITVSAGTEKWKKCVYGAVDSLSVPAGILLDGVDASSADAKAVVVTGHCEIADLELTWDSSFDSAPKKAWALAKLDERDIRNRRLA